MRGIPFYVLCAVVFLLCILDNSQGVGLHVKRKVKLFSRFHFFKFYILRPKGQRNSNQIDLIKSNKFIYFKYKSYKEDLFDPIVVIRI